MSFPGCMAAAPGLWMPQTLPWAFTATWILEDEHASSSSSVRSTTLELPPCTISHGGFSPVPPVEMLSSQQPARFLDQVYAACFPNHILPFLQGRPRRSTRVRVGAEGQRAQVARPGHALSTSNDQQLLYGMNDVPLHSRNRIAVAPPTPPPSLYSLNNGGAVGRAWAIVGVRTRSKILRQISCASCGQSEHELEN